MCEIGNEIKLCTCVPNGLNAIVHNKKSRSRQNRDKFTWTLNKYVGDSENMMDGMLIYPDSVLSENLTTERMLSELNDRNCFDFDYEPNEGDNLLIYNPEKYIKKYLSFIYRNGKWIADSYNKFRDKIEKINYGNVTFD